MDADAAAGLRTHAIVSLATALMMLVSTYGFNSVPGPGQFVVFDPSRVAVQVVSGTGFLGAGSHPCDYAILQVFLQTGIRVSELCALPRKDVDFEQRLLRVVGEGRRRARSSSRSAVFRRSRTTWPSTLKA